MAVLRVWPITRGSRWPDSFGRAVFNEFARSRPFVVIREALIAAWSHRGAKRGDAQRYARVLASHNAAERCLCYESLCACVLVSGRTWSKSTNIFASFVGRSNDLKGMRVKEWRLPTRASPLCGKSSAFSRHVARSFNLEVNVKLYSQGYRDSPAFLMLSFWSSCLVVKAGL